MHGLLWKRRYAKLWNEKGRLFTSLAHALDPRIDSYVAAGIMTAETGQQFFCQGRAIARFEAHVFWRRWGNTTPTRRTIFQTHFIRQKPHRWRSDPAGAFQTYHGNQNSEWEVIEFARTLDADANVRAVESASFGAGQTMGFNFARVGFNSALELLQHYQMREQAQVEGIFNYIATLPPVRRQNVINGILVGNFLPLSQAYGPQNPVAHAHRIAQAVARMQQVVEGGQQATP